MTRAEAERAVQEAEAQYAAVDAQHKAFLTSWTPAWSQHPDAEKLRTEPRRTPERPSMTVGEAAFKVEEARRQLAMVGHERTIEAVRRAAARVEAAKAKVDPILVDAEKKLAAVRSEFVAAMEEFNELWKQVPELARDLLPIPFCVAAPYQDGCIVKTISAKP